MRHLLSDLANHAFCRYRASISRVSPGPGGGWCCNGSELFAALAAHSSVAAFGRTYDYRKLAVGAMCIEWLHNYLPGYRASWRLCSACAEVLTHETAAAGLAIDRQKPRRKFASDSVSIRGVVLEFVAKFALADKSLRRSSSLRHDHTNAAHRRPTISDRRNTAS